MKRTKKIILYVFLLGCTVIVISEAASKLLANCQLSGIIYDKQLGWRLKKKYGWPLNGMDSTRTERKINFNRRGFRDRDHSLVKDEGSKRIMFLGDSYTAGLEYSNSEIFTSLFDKMLNANATDKINYEIMNISVPAWATDQQYKYLKEEGMSYDPDYIFLMIAPNDIRETYGKQFFYLRNGNLEEKSIPSIPWKARVYWLLANYSCAFQRLQTKFKSQYGSFSNIFEYFPISFPVGDKLCSDTNLFTKEVPVEILAARELFKTILLTINQICKNSHCKLLLAIIPTKIEYDGSLKEDKYQPGKIAEYIKVIAEENDIPFLDLGFYLRAEEDDPLKIFISQEYHLNDYGHAFVARKLLPFFNSNQ